MRTGVRTRRLRVKAEDGGGVARIVVVFARIRRCRLRESFCHVRLIKPDTDVMYPVQDPLPHIGYPVINGTFRICWLFSHQLYQS
jgi:hypothetical protein